MDARRRPGRDGGAATAQRVRRRLVAGPQRDRRSPLGGADATGDQYLHRRADARDSGSGSRSCTQGPAACSPTCPPPAVRVSRAGTVPGSASWSTTSSASNPSQGVDFFRSRRPFDLLRSPRPGIPVCQLEPAVLLWAGYEATTKAAHGVAAAVVQQRLTTATRMIRWIDQLRPLRRAKPLKRTLSFVDGGAHSGAELELGRLCRRFGIRPPIVSAAGRSNRPDPLDRCRVGPARRHGPGARDRWRVPLRRAPGSRRRQAQPSAHDPDPDGRPLHRVRAHPRAARGRSRPGRPGAVGSCAQDSGIALRQAHDPVRRRTSGTRPRTATAPRRPGCHPTAGWPSSCTGHPGS